MFASGISYRDVFTFNKNRNVLAKALRYAVKGMTADLEGPLETKHPVQAINKLYKSFMSGSGMLANRPLGGPREKGSPPPARGRWGDNPGPPVREGGKAARMSRVCY